MAAASSPPVSPQPNGSGSFPWTFLVVVLAGAASLLALVPARLEAHGVVGSSLVKARVGFAAVAIGLFVGFVIPVLAGGMP